MRSITALLCLSCILVGACAFQFRFDEDLPEYRVIEKGPVVTIPDLGSVQGGRTYSIKSRRPIHTFYNIPYGEVTQKSRFKQAEEVLKWPTTIKGNTYDSRTVCLQPGYTPGKLMGSENCLKLQVFVPQGFLPEESPSNTSLPVYFFIHGGAFITGDAKYYGPHKLLERDIIMVTIHYRLGPAGFFCAHTDGAPGNAGLYDQAMALNWVHKHIHNFGGDPHRITLAGESAGAASVTLLQVSPLSRDKISGIILESGSALTNWAIDNDPLAMTKKLAERLKCQLTAPEDGQQYYEEVTSCVVSKDINLVHKVFYQLMQEDRVAGGLGTNGASPVVQKAGSPKFIDKKWIHYFNKGEYAKVPILNGANRDEGSFLVAYMNQFTLAPHGLTWANLDHLKTLTPYFFRTIGVREESGTVIDSTINYYIPDDQSVKTYLPGLIDMAGAILLKSGGHEILKKMYNAGVPTYQYAFNYYRLNTSLWYFVISPDPGFYHGVTHTDEMLYLYSMPLKRDDEMDLIRDRMVELWTNFVIYKDPTPDEREYDKLDIPKWKTYDDSSKYYLAIDRNTTLEQDYEATYHVTSRLLNPPDPSPVEDSDEEKPEGKVTCPEMERVERELVAYKVSFGSSIAVLVISITAIAATLYIRKRRRKFLTPIL